MNRKKYKYVILSPHLDDAVFSCGGLIAQNPNEVLVVTVFTNYKDSTKSANPTFHALDRSKEDLQAASTLKFEVLHLDYTDGILRNKNYQSMINLFGEPVTADAELNQRLKLTVKQILDSLEFEKVIAPLGVGWHVDHQLVFNSALEFLSTEKVLFYEDNPYKSLSDLTERRIHQLTGTGKRQNVFSSILLGTRELLNWPLFDAFKAWQKPFVALGVFVFFARKLVQRRYFLPPEKLSLNKIEINVEANIALKITAAKAYDSQYRLFYRNDTDHKILEKFENYYRCLRKTTETSDSSLNK